MKQDPLVTAIIPTYRRPKLLKRAVHSLLAQTFSQFEILISDNASGDSTDQVIEELKQVDSRVKSLKQPRNMGAVANFNIPLMQVHTPYVCFLPDDDFFAPFFFQEVMPCFDVYPDCAFCGGGGVMIDEAYQVRSILTNGQTIPATGYYPPPQALFEYLYSSFGIAFPSLIFKTKVLKDLGGFDLRICNGMDEYLVSQISARYPVYLFTDRPFYFGFQHAQSLSAQVDYFRFEREARLLHETIMNVSLPPNMQKEINLFFIKRRLKIMRNAYRYFSSIHDFVQAKVFAKKVLALDPSLKWNMKKTSASLFSVFPFLFNVSLKLKALEKTVRDSLKSDQEEQMSEDSIETNVLCTEEAFLQAYAKELDALSNMKHQEFLTEELVQQTCLPT